MDRYLSDVITVATYNVVIDHVHCNRRSRHARHIANPLWVRGARDAALLAVLYAQAADALKRLRSKRGVRH